MFNFYVYVYLNPLKRGIYSFNSIKFDYEPFYVGKGCGDRCNAHVSIIDTRNKLKQNIINKIISNNKKPIIIKLYSNITEYSAFRLEKCLIKKIGRRDKKLGSLSNLSNGGEGNAGVIYTYERRISMINENKPIIKYNNKGIVVEYFKNIVDLSIKYPHLRTNHIHRACKSKGKRRIDNYFWKYSDGEEINDVIELQDRFKIIIQYDLDGNLVKTWDCVIKLKKNGYSSGAILKCCRNNEKENLFYKFKNNMWFFKKNVIDLKILSYDEKKASGDYKIRKEKIKMFNKNNELIGVYLPKELKFNGFKTKSIYACCNKKLHTTQGYKWEWF